MRVSFKIITKKDNEFLSETTGGGILKEDKNLIIGMNLKKESIKIMFSDKNLLIKEKTYLLEFNPFSKSVYIKDTEFGKLRFNLVLSKFNYAKKRIIIDYFVENENSKFSLEFSYRVLGK